MNHYLKAKLRDGVKKTFHALGYDITPYPKLQGPYEKITAKSYYAPWKEDPVFTLTHATILLNTMVDKHRCFELWSLVEQSVKVPGYLLEIGVWRGGTGALIAKKAALMGINDPIYLCDTFTGVVKASAKDAHYSGGEHSDTSLAIAQALTDKLHLKNVHFLQGIFPDQTAAQIPAGPIRFCHVDVDVYESTRDILDWVWPRLSVSGIVAFDDYGMHTTTGIKDYVNENKHLADRVFIHNLNGHAIWIKTR